MRISKQTADWLEFGALLLLNKSVLVPVEVRVFCHSSPMESKHQSMALGVKPKYTNRLIEHLQNIHFGCSIFTRLASEALDLRGRVQYCRAAILWSGLTRLNSAIAAFAEFIHGRFINRSPEVPDTLIN